MDDSYFIRADYWLSNRVLFTAGGMVFLFSALCIAALKTTNAFGLPGLPSPILRKGSANLKLIMYQHVPRRMYNAPVFTVELHLSGRRLSGTPIIRILLALRVNLLLL